MEILLGALAYILFTFPLAYIWHLKIFPKKYARWQYFEGEASPPLGLLTILIQGFVLSYAYHLAVPEHSAQAIAIFILILGLLHWSTHVLAAMAKNKATRTWGFLLMETFYLAIQFGVFGFLLCQMAKLG